jgi:hypothetical protein
MKYASRYEWFTCDEPAEIERAEREGDTPFRARILVNPNGNQIRAEAQARKSLLLQTTTELEYLAILAERVIDWELQLPEPEDDTKFFDVAAPGSHALDDASCLGCV